MNISIPLFLPPCDVYTSVNNEGYKVARKVCPEESTTRKVTRFALWGVISLGVIYGVFRLVKKSK